ncbi:MAG TPA: glycoside hydrolase family 88 protein [Chitinophaga sp.]|uniref:glycoside hydrolase family 88/105 protein n=1 Tax=Chitinophaga sp. TaxID=1869181 RepID=UPI002DB96472|nr:glycoside hydrolase family 88 protein [Chitinophaga sp.]HEU4554787.1 glycoside hydrolase family 88 protein [Chitinophaga sp.]
MQRHSKIGYAGGCLCMFMLLFRMAAAQQPPALAAACKVANRLMNDTRFEWRWTPQKEVLGMQVIGFRFLNIPQQQQAYALRYAAVLTDTIIRFGITTAAPVQVYINRQPVYRQGIAKVANLREIAYNRFTFSNYFTASLHKGNNEILISYTAAPVVPVVFLRAVTPAGDEETAVSFTSHPLVKQWWYAGPFMPGALKALPAAPGPGAAYQYWQTAPQRWLPGLAIDSQAAYQRESYANWHYSHGTAVWSLLALQQATGDSSYGAFVKKYTRFLLDNYSNLQFQYDSLYAWRGSYHRVFRRTMLDDAGAAALPFAALYLQQKDTALYNRLLGPLLQYITETQVRLADGTFCRPEPVAFTVWADDLFMSVPFLVTMAKATGRQLYLDDAVRQVLQFRKYLLDPQTGLYKHGWFSTTQQQSVAYWGRANGWVAWATAVLLQNMPARHPARKEILRAFQKHMAALLSCQSPNGMWRQLLNRENSYEETSCTAIFAYAMATGVQQGWLPQRYKAPALKAWEAVARKIDGSGVVHGICQGTEIGSNEAFYLQRKTIDNDPRGLGAVIAAGAAIAALQQQTR